MPFTMQRASYYREILAALPCLASPRSLERELTGKAFCRSAFLLAYFSISGKLAFFHMPCSLFVIDHSNCGMRTELPFQSQHLTFLLYPGHFPIFCLLAVTFICRPCHWRYSLTRLRSIQTLTSSPLASFACVTASAACWISSRRGG